VLKSKGFMQNEVFLFLKRTPPLKMIFQLFEFVKYSYGKLLSFFYYIAKVFASKEEQMTSMEIFVENVKEFMEKGGIDRKTLANNSKLSYKTVCDILNGKRKDVQFDTIISLSIGLGLRPAELFDTAFKKNRNIE
jgi:DNA-binding Xre family transcriptional regulator